MRRSAWDIGLLKTLNAYAWPMHRWMHRAAGGTSQRLKPGGAIEFDRSRNDAEANCLSSGARRDLRAVYGCGPPATCVKAEADG